MEHPYCTVEEALEELRAGRIIISIDDPDRENEGALPPYRKGTSPFWGTSLSLLRHAPSNGMHEFG